MKQRVLIVCIGNSCRSQMAEGFTRQIHGDRFEVHSAGVRPSTLDPFAIEVMIEAGVDISEHCSKTLESLRNIDFDYVVTVCDDGATNCPYVPAKSGVLHHPFPDPPALTREIEDRNTKLDVYRDVRDQVRGFVERLPETLLSATDSCQPKSAES